MHFIKRLRQSQLDGDSQHLTTKDGSTDDVVEATHVRFADDAYSYTMEQQSGYRAYPVKAVLFLLTNRALDHPAYLSLLSRTSIPPISLIDRRDMLDYILGHKETSANVVGSAASLPESSGSKRNASPSTDGRNVRQRTDPTSVQHGELFVEALEAIQSKKAASLIDSDDYSDDKRVSDIKTIESVLLVDVKSKEFTRIQSLALDKLIRPPQPVSHSRQSSSHSKPPVSSSNAAKKLSTKAGPPIIIVPPGVSSTLNLFNVKELLIDNKFVPAEEYRQRGEEKPTEVILERDPSKTPPKAEKKFLVLDSHDSIKDWSRVVAVFTAGQTWQFRAWKWDKPIDLFQNVLGFCLKFQDEPPLGQVSSWNVEIMNIHRSRRYLDQTVVYNFWQKLDAFVAKRMG